MARGDDHPHPARAERALDLVLAGEDSDLPTRGSSGPSLPGVYAPAGLAERRRVKAYDGHRRPHATQAPPSARLRRPLRRARRGARRRRAAPRHAHGGPADRHHAGGPLAADGGRQLQRDGHGALPQGTGAFRDAMPLFRVHPELVTAGGAVSEFAGSIFDLAPGTTYESSSRPTIPTGATRPPASRRHASRAGDRSAAPERRRGEGRGVAPGRARRGEARRRHHPRRAAPTPASSR